MIKQQLTKHSLNLCCFVMLSFTTSAQYIQSGFNIGGIGYDAARCVVSDGNGNWLVAGSFQNTVDFDPGEAILSSTVGADLYASFICKYDGNFAPLALAKFTGSGNAFIKSMSLDSDQNVYVTGNFTGNVDFNPGEETYTISSNGGNDIFVCKLNASLEFLWAIRIGGSNTDYPLSIRVSNSGQAVVSGSFDGILSVTTINGEVVLDSFPYLEPLMVFAMDQDGAIQWVSYFAAELDIPVADNDMDLDSQGNIYLTGSYEYQMDADTGPETYLLQSDGWNNYIIKLNSAGDFVWAKQIGNYDYDTDFVYAFDVSPTDVVSMAGRAVGQIDIDPGPGEFLLTNNQSSGYVVNLDTDGEFIDGIEFVGSTWNYFSCIRWDEQNRLTCIMDCSGNCDLDPQEGTLTATGQQVIILDENHSLIENISLANQPVGDFYVSADAAGNTILYGYAYNGLSVNIGGVSGDIVIPNNGLDDGVIIYTTPCPEVGCEDALACNYNPEAICAGGFCIYPTPADFDCDGEISVDDLLLFIDSFGCVGNCGDFDLNNDGVVNTNDLYILIGMM